MDVKKWVPWNWFKKEEEDAGKTVSLDRPPAAYRADALSSPMEQFHREIDRLFENAFRGFGGSPFRADRPLLPQMADGMLKPTLDLGATENEYTISVEIPGVDARDLDMEVVDDTLIIRGEKKCETEKKDKNYYRMERSYGSFQRVLSLPDDADQDNIRADFKRGVLSVTIPRKALAQADAKRIEVQSA